MQGSIQSLLVSSVCGQDQRGAFELLLGSPSQE